MSVRKAYSLRLPIGVEKILCQAALDPRLREALLIDREGTLGRLRLLPSERACLAAVPAPVLAAVIEAIPDPQHSRRQFLKSVGACALAATAASLGCNSEEDSVPLGCQADEECGPEEICMEGRCLPVGDAGMDTLTYTDYYSPGDRGDGGDLPLAGMDALVEPDTLADED